MENIDEIKKNKIGYLKYRLKNANVYVSDGGFHYIDFFDEIDSSCVPEDSNFVSKDIVEYIEKNLQANKERFLSQIKLVKKYLNPINKKILDVGCGGGLFLSLLQNEGAIVIGNELSSERAQYARKKYNLSVIEKSIEGEDIINNNMYSNAFDCVTMWDVIEHVNYPLSLLLSVRSLLKRDGVVFIDTPCRDSFYHKFGELSYSITKGKYPTFLNSMYSAHPFGHKQIFSIKEVCDILQHNGFKVLSSGKFHELSFPYRFYLKKIFKYNFLVLCLLPIVSVLLFLFPIKNKMIIVAQKV
jgi:2-polyprenyl-6-hydroxyphenyl methylase/3-demethylubiquinone-9 3-methyltransferase